MPHRPRIACLVCDLLAEARTNTPGRGNGRLQAAAQVEAVMTPQQPDGGVQSGSRPGRGDDRGDDREDDAPVDARAPPTPLQAPKASAQALVDISPILRAERSLFGEHTTSLLDISVEEGREEPDTSGASLASLPGAILSISQQLAAMPAQLHILMAASPRGSSASEPAGPAFAALPLVEISDAELPHAEESASRPPTVQQATPPVPSAEGPAPHPSPIQSPAPVMAGAPTSDTGASPLESGRSQLQVGRGWGVALVGRIQAKALLGLSPPSPKRLPLLVSLFCATWSEQAESGAFWCGGPIGRRGRELELCVRWLQRVIVVLA